MTDKIKLKKIILETKDGKPIELSIDEAKELYEQLHSLFGEKTTYMPLAPIIIERNKWDNPYNPNPFWYTTTTSEIYSPNAGGLDVQCSITGDSGMVVSYYGDAIGTMS